jgi:hypothetical protein
MLDKQVKHKAVNWIEFTNVKVDKYPESKIPSTALKSGTIIQA